MDGTSAREIGPGCDQDPPKRKEERVVRKTGSTESGLKTKHDKGTGVSGLGGVGSGRNPRPVLLCRSLEGGVSSSLPFLTFRSDRSQHPKNEIRTGRRIYQYSSTCGQRTTLENPRVRPSHSRAVNVNLHLNLGPTSVQGPRFKSHKRGTVVHSPTPDLEHR